MNCVYIQLAIGEVESWRNHGFCRSIMGSIRLYLGFLNPKFLYIKYVMNHIYGTLLGIYGTTFVKRSGRVKEV